MLLAETPRQLPTTQRATRRGARRLRVSGAALALSGALALTLGSPLLPALAASPQPATWIAGADRSADNLAPPADDALLRALLNHIATSRQAVTPADQAALPASDALLRALLNHVARSSQAVATANQASDALLRALLNRAATATQAATPAAQTMPPTDDALAQTELTVGETLVIPTTQAAADAIIATPSDSVAQDTVSYYVVQPGDTLSGIALAFYGNGNLWPTIFNANTDKIADPHWIYPDQQLLIPAIGITGNAVPIASSQAFFNRGLGQYTVQSGDTLSGIAAYTYGNGNAWWGIYQANAGQIYNLNLIYPGQVLAIP